MKLIVFGALPAPYNRGGCGEPPLIQAASTIKKNYSSESWPFNNGHEKTMCAG